MKRTTRYLSRLLAVLALAAVVVAVIVIVSAFKNESKETTTRGNGKAHPTRKPIASISI